MTEEELAKQLAKFAIDQKGRAYRPVEKEILKKLIDESDSFPKFVTSLFLAFR